MPLRLYREVATSRFEHAWSRYLLSKILDMFNGGELTLPVQFTALSRYSLYRLRQGVIVDDAPNHCIIEILFDDMESHQQ